MVLFVQETYLNYSNYDTILQPKTKLIKKYSFDVQENGMLKFPSLNDNIEVSAQLNTAELKDSAWANPWKVE